MHTILRHSEIARRPVNSRHRNLGGARVSCELIKNYEGYFIFDEDPVKNVGEPVIYSYRHWHVMN